MTREPITSRTILRFYFPLALSWVFMGLDGPISVSVMSGLRSAKVNTAGLLILLSIAIWIESPVIDLLSTSTTLAKDRAGISTINRFSIWLIVWVTLAHALVTFTPLYYVVTRTVLGVEPAVAEVARPALALMLPWSGLIGWRRSRQGIMIRNCHTKVIGLGTFLRVSILALVDVLLLHTTKLDGLTIAASGLITSVAVEAVFIHLISRPIIREIPAITQEVALTTRRLWAFHMPLTATTMVKLATAPIVAAGLDRLPNSTGSLAAYEVAWTILFLFRAIAFCLPEVVIALYRDEDARVALRRFCLTIGAGSSLLLALMCLFRLDVLIFVRVLGIRPNIAEPAHWIFFACSPLPLLDSSMSFMLGALTAHHLTVARMVAVFFSTLALVAAVVIGVGMRWTAPVMVGGCIAISLMAELVVLCLAWVKAKPETVPSSAMA